ncbi:YkoP family protein [Bacillus methanolicus]|uniref:YkoP-like domain-containing protein n=1 Tax=Bacillus methanolicus (strain MGA3 / ATCC 53907) TaxID=796606 RepID=I3E985_BACMM|nr:hypothetical protein [Bacillus methanolicus]AIE60311.1 hypothetical protein BMMGA3_09565 [Bacillus methanolicus MGA3]EIJ83056.1 hypothetical protein MGA3_07530 [Bacillus methanolicus MGA3]
MRGYILSIWSLIDPIYFFCSRLTYPPCEGTEGNILRIRLTKYKGRNIVLSDGTQINRNDLLVKIHLHNARLLKELKDIKSELKKAKIIYRYVQKSLPGVEIYIRNYCHSQEIKGIIGISLLNKGCERLGFEIFDISHPVYKWYKWFSFLPIAMLSSQNTFIWRILKYQKPHYLFMSTNKLSNMYRNEIPNRH